MNTNTPGRTAENKQESKPSRSSESPEGNSSSSEYIEHYHTVEGTPFTIILYGEEYHICLAQNIVANKPFKTIEEAENYIAEKPWQLMLVAGYIYGKMVEANIEKQKKGVE